ncbi:38728_t:CDS:2, partial [Gigaspora margarita]
TKANKVIGLALIQYWEYEAIDQKAIGKLQTIFRMTQIAAKMAWEESLSNTIYISNSEFDTNDNTYDANKENILDYHPVQYENSKTGLQYLFSCGLSQQIFIQNFQLDIKDN